MPNTQSTTPVAGAAVTGCHNAKADLAQSVDNRPPLPADGWYQLQEGKNEADGLIVRLADGKPVFFPDTDMTGAEVGDWVSPINWRYHEPADHDIWWNVWFAEVGEMHGVAFHVRGAKSPDEAEEMWSAAADQARREAVGDDGWAWAEMVESAKLSDFPTLREELTKLTNPDRALAELPEDIRNLFAGVQLEIRNVMPSPLLDKVGAAANDGILGLPEEAEGLRVETPDIPAGVPDGKVDKSWQHGYGDDPWTTTGWWGTTSGRKAASAFQEAQRNAGKAMSQQDGIALLRGLFQA